MFISNLDAGVECGINKFAVSNKLGCAVDSLEGLEVLQRALHTFKHWTIINGMKLDKSKYWSPHLGQRKAKQPCRKGFGGAGGQQLGVSQLCALTVKTANHVLGSIKTSTVSQKKWLSCSIQCWCGLTSVLCLTISERMLRPLKVPRGGRKQSW